MHAIDTQAGPPLRLKAVPLLITAALALAIPYAAALLALVVLRLLHLPAPGGQLLPYLYVQHGFQLALALAAIAVLKRQFVPADYGLHWPRGRTYLWPALLWGVLFGVLMTVVDYAPQLLAHTRPPLGFPATRDNVWGWSLFEGLYVGPTEEIPFRALLVTYLAATMPGRARIGRFSMNWAGIIVAFMFALLHAGDFATRPWPEALGQQVYAFALGVLYAYWLEKSGSILSPIIGHNVSDLVEYLLLFAWVGVL